MEKYDFNAASNHLYNFVYDDFCSQYLEMSKVALNSDNPKTKEVTEQVLYECLKDIILLIYPYTPFIAEELYLNLPEHLESIMLERYPIYNKDIVDASVNEEILTLFELIKDVRNYKIENKLAPNAKLDLSLNLKIKVFDDFVTYLNRFTFSTVKLIGEEILSMKGDLKVYPKANLLIVNEAGKEDMIKRLDAEIEFEKAEIERANKMLSNPNFISKAPEAKVNLEKEKLAKHEQNLASLIEKRNKL